MSVSGAAEPELFAVAFDGNTQLSMGMWLWRVYTARRTVEDERRHVDALHRWVSSGLPA